MSVHPKFSVDHSKEPVYGYKFTYEPDTKLYEKVWVPKIKAYNKAREDAVPKEYLAPAELVPENLDEVHFNATLIPPKVLDEEALAITGLTATEIVKKIASKELTSVKVLTAFIKRATIADQLTSCAMEILFDEGLERAKSLDEYFESTGKLVGPLHGLPISLKEHYDFKGHVTHAAYVSALDRVTPEFSTTNQILYDLGAVFYIRTNEPQSLMHFDSCNNITDRCKNSYNTSASPGGSSSGEGALIGMRGSPLGLGSDIGGSIRGPAAFNGLWGLKPTTKRISLGGCFSGAIDTFQDAVGAVLGPLANSADDIELFMKSYVSAKPWLKDQYLVPLPWNELVKDYKPSDLKIAIIYDDGVVKPHPPIIRALKEVEAKLRKAGSKVITWEPHRTDEAFQVIGNLYTADGNYSAINALALSGEPLLKLTDHYLSFGQGDKELGAIEYEYYWNTREVIRQEYLELFEKRDIDFIISPTYVGTAGKPETAKYWGYTTLWNLLDYSSVTFPTGMFGDKEIDLKDEDYKPRNKTEEVEYGLYDPEGSDGMPIGLTLNGRRYTEEEVLKAARLVHEIITK